MFSYQMARLLYQFGKNKWLFGAGPIQLGSWFDMLLQLNTEMRHMRRIILQAKFKSN